MKYKYVLVENEDKTTNWNMMIEAYSIPHLCRATELWKESAISQMLDGRKGLTPDFIVNASMKMSDNLAKHINNGEVILVNRLGGYRLLNSGVKILKTITCSEFPSDKGYINGLLSPEGEFIPCDYGHHYEIAENIQDNENRYITISSDPIGNNSAIFVGDSITEKQLNFLRENIDKLKPEQLKILKAKKIV